MDKRRRHKIYVDALRFFRENTVVNGMCTAITMVRQWDEKEEELDPNPYTNMASYPEIHRHRPRHMYKGTNYWWSPKNRKRRTDVLEQAIKETE